MPKKPNPTNSTLRNVRAAKTRTLTLKARVARLERRVRDIARSLKGHP